MNESQYAGVATNAFPAAGALELGGTAANMLMQYYGMKKQAEENEKYNRQAMGRADKDREFSKAELRRAERNEKRRRRADNKVKMAHQIQSGLLRNSASMSKLSEIQSQRRA